MSVIEGLRFPRKSRPTDRFVIRPLAFTALLPPLILRCVVLSVPPALMTLVEPGAKVVLLLLVTVKVPAPVWKTPP